MEKYFREDRLKDRLKQLSKITDKWGLLRQIYMEKMPEIWAASKAHRSGSIDPYFVDWIMEFSPIESDAWQAIRGRGVPLYPQFPVFNYFVDFANPYLRIGLELDGKDWHDQDKDRARDQMLAEFGWRIFRVPGSEAVAKFESAVEVVERGGDVQEQERALEHWILNTCDGVVAAIDAVYIRGDVEAHNGLCLRTLDRHRLAKFELLKNDDS